MLAVCFNEGDHIDSVARVASDEMFVGALTGGVDRNPPAPAKRAALHIMAHGDRAPSPQLSAIHSGRFRFGTDEKARQRRQ
jgi:hypothetical protein